MQQLLASAAQASCSWTAAAALALTTRGTTSSESSASQLLVLASRSYRLMGYVSLVPCIDTHPPMAGPARWSSAVLVSILDQMVGASSASRTRGHKVMVPGAGPIAATQARSFERTALVSAAPTSRAHQQTVASAWLPSALRPTSCWRMVAAKAAQPTHEDKQTGEAAARTTASQIRCFGPMEPA